MWVVGDDRGVRIVHGRTAELVLLVQVDHALAQLQEGLLHTYRQTDRHRENSKGQALYSLPTILDLRELYT